MAYSHFYQRVIEAKIRMWQTLSLLVYLILKSIEISLGKVKSKIRFKSFVFVNELYPSIFPMLEIKTEEVKIFIS